MLQSAGHKISTMKMRQGSSTFKMDIAGYYTNTSLRDVITETKVVFNSLNLKV
jgi:hypothetical protein